MMDKLKKALILFAVFPLILFVSSAYGADDWGIDFDFGVDMSAYNTDKPGEEGFSKLKLFLGATAKQRISERLSILEGVHFRALNIEEEDTVTRDSECIDVMLGFEYVLTPWPPPLFKWLPLTWLPRLRDQTRVYFKLTGDFIFSEDSEVDQDNFNTTFIGLGWRYNNPVSKMDGTYIELGGGSSERFDSHWRYLKNNIKVFYQVSDRRDGWKAFLTSQFDVGSGDDDYRFGLGFTRDFEFLADLIRGFAGKK